MPDTELFQLAKEDQLQEDEKLVEQVRRMLHSPIDKAGLRRGARFGNSRRTLSSSGSARVLWAENSSLLIHSQPSMILSLKAE